MLHFNTAAYLENLKAAARPRFDYRNVSDWQSWRREFRAAPDKCELFVGDGGHRYYKARVWDFVREYLEAT